MDTDGVAIADIWRHSLFGPKVSRLRPFSWGVLFLSGFFPLCEGSLLSEAYELAFPEFPVTRVEKCDSTSGLLGIRSEYYHILDKSYSDGRKGTTVSYWRTRLSGGFSGLKHGIAVCIVDSRPYASWEITNGNYGAEITQELRTASFTIARFIPAGELGIHLGGISSPYNTSDESGMGTIGGFYFNLTRESFSLEAEVLKNQLFHLNETLTHTRNDNFRTFPISLKSDRAALTAKAQTPRWYAILKTHWSREGKGLPAETENRMPLELILQRGGLQISAGYISNCTLSVDIRGERWAGFLENKEFFLADSLTIRRFAADMTFSGPKGYCLSGFVDYLYGVLQRGRMDTRPFSSWTLFKRLEYSLRNLDYTWFEPGIEVDRRFRWKTQELHLGASAAYLRMQVTGKVNQIERIVMIPVTTVRYSGTLWGIRALLAKASLSYALHHGPLSFQFDVSQRVFGSPFANPAETGGTESADGIDVRIRGGTRIAGTIQLRL